MKNKIVSIKTRLILGFSTITLTTIMLALFSIYTFKEETKYIKETFNHPYVVSNTVKNIHATSMSIHTAIHLLLTDTKHKSEAETIEIISKYHSSIEADFKLILQRYLGPKEDVETAYKLYTESTHLRNQLITIYQEKGSLEAQHFMSTIGKKHINELTKKITILSQYADKKAQEFYTQAVEKEKETVSLLIVVLIIVTLLSFILAIKTIQSITIPLNTLLSISTNISKGNFTLPKNQSIKDIQSRTDEFGDVFNSYNNILNHLVQPYNNIIKSNRDLVEITAEVQRLLVSFDENVIASKTDTRGKIIYVSQAFQDISGYTKEELIGQNQNFVRHPDMPAQLFQNLWRTIKKGETWQGNIKNRKKDGSFFWIKANISPDIDSKGKIIGYNAINNEISILKAYEELSNTLEERIQIEIEKNTQQTQHMIQQSRLAQMGEMISMIAHQWRQPLSSISAISGTLTLDIEMENFDKSFFKDRLSSINDLSQHLSSTIDDFRGFFKEDKQAEIVEIKTVIYSAISIIEQTLKNRGISLLVQVTSEDKVQTYINELKQVLLNIVKNAEDVLLEKKIESAQIIVSSYTQGSDIYITVEDNGEGISLEIVDKIFDPYFSTKTAKDGTGLGLYMSKTIIEEHCQGKLLFENKSQGALFTIVLSKYQEGVS